MISNGVKLSVVEVALEQSKFHSEMALEAINRCEFYASMAATEIARCNFYAAIATITIIEDQPRKWWRFWRIDHALQRINCFFHIYPVTYIMRQLRQKCL